MSKYYNINGLKVRVSDHEPNYGAPGRGNDIELYVRSADNLLLSIEAQLEHICELRGYNIADFQEILDEWQDGTYSKDVFCQKDEDDDEGSSNNVVTAMKAAASKSNDEKLEGHYLSRFAKHAEIKALSELTGVSQSYIKKHFGIHG